MIGTEKSGYGNVAMGLFYGRYKTATVRDHTFTDEDELRANIFDFIEIFYNRFRKHTSHGYLSPIQVESTQLPYGASTLPIRQLNS